MQRREAYEKRMGFDMKKARIAIVNIAIMVGILIFVIL